MSFAATAIFSLGSSKTGLTDLRCQPLTSAGVATGPAITTGFVEQGRGIYTWSGNVPDDAVQAKCTSVGTATVLDVVALEQPDTDTVGSGAWVVTIATVDEDGEPVADAVVRFQSGGVVRNGVTNADGELLVGVDSGNYLLSVTREGFTYAPSEHAVSSNVTLTVELVTYQIPLSPLPDIAVAYLYAMDENQTTVEGVNFEFALVGKVGAEGVSYSRDAKAVVSGDDGLVSFAALKEATYQGRRQRADSSWGPWVTFKTSTAESFAIPVVYGLQAI